MDQNIFDISANNAEKVYVEGKLHPIKVGMRKVSLQNGTDVLLYDTTGSYTEKGYKIDTKKGLPKIRKEWIEKRIEEDGEFHTQLWYAKRGIITPEMEYVAIRESQGCKPEEAITPEMVCKEIADGKAILPSNYRHPEAEPMIIGRKFLVKINANIGNSALGSASNAEFEKAILWLICF